MYNLLRREIEQALKSSGQSWAVFDEYQIQQANSEETWEQYKNIGVLYINGTTLRLLPNNKGLTGSLQLDMCLQIEEGVNLEEVVSRAVTALLASHNGVAYTDGNNYQYSLNFNQPTTTGRVETTAFGVDFMRYTMTIAVSVTNGIALGDNAYFKVKIGNIYVPIQNISTMTVVYNSEIDTRTMANTNKTKSSVDGQSWGLELVFNYDVDSTTNGAQELILDNADTAPNAVYTVQYSLDGINYKQKNVVAHNPQIQANKGDTITVSVSFAESADV